MNRYRVTHELEDVVEIIEAETRGKAKHAYCELLGLGDAFADSGYIIETLTIRKCQGCGNQYEGGRKDTCCEDCLRDAFNAGRAAGDDLLASAPDTWPDVMRDKWSDGFRVYRLRKMRDVARVVSDDDGGMVLPSMKRTRG
jgi:Fe-S-cluster-containing dehydrogenase component